MRSTPGTRTDLPWACGGILLAPLLWVLAATTGPVQSASIDANVYLGYMNNYGRLLDRYGVTYYSTRIAAIFPERLLGDVLGRMAAFYVWHYILAVAVLASVYAIGRRRYGWPTATIVTSLMLALPWLAGPMLWDYVDGPGVAYVFVGIFLLVGLRARPCVRAAGAGAAFSLAVTSNFFILGIVVVFLFAWSLFGFPDRTLRPRAVGLSAVVGGFVATQLALGVFMELRYPRAGFGFMDINLTFSDGIVRGAIDTKFQPLGDAFRSQPFLWLPVFAGLAGIALACATPVLRPPPGRRRFIFFAATFMTTCWLLYLVLHARGVGILSLWYYGTYFMPAFVLVACSVIGEMLARLSSSQAHRATIVALLVLIAGLAVFRSAPDAVPGVIVIICGVALVAFLPLANRWPIGLATIVLVSLFASPFAFARGGDDFYRRVVDPAGIDDAFQRDVYQHAIDFQDAVLESVPHDRSVGFWYDDSTRWMTAVQSTLLWAYSRLAPRMEMPRLDRATVDRAQQLDYLVLLSPRPEPLRDGVVALCRRGVTVEPIAHNVLRGEVVDLHYAVYRRAPSSTCPAPRAQSGTT